MNTKYGYFDNERREYVITNPKRKGSTGNGFWRSRETGDETRYQWFVSSQREPFMDQAQSPEDGALGIIRGCMDPDASSGDFYGPEGWTGFPKKLEPEALLSDPDNVRINWEGCEAAVGAFEV